MSAKLVRTFGQWLRSAAIAGAVLCAAQAAATPATAGLLDFLFSRPQSQPQPVYMIAPRPGMAMPGVSAADAKPHRPRVVRDVPRGPRPYVAPQVAAGPLGRFLHDTSLRRGDIVATADGLMVFQGRGGAGAHKPSDFVPVASASVATGARRSDLISLDRTVRTTTANVEFVAEKAEPKALVIAKRADTDVRSSLEAPTDANAALASGAGQLR